MTGFSDKRLGTLTQAVQYRQEGRWDDAARLCAALLEAAPDDVDVLHLLGVLQAQAGRREEALRLIGKALSLAPDHVGALSNQALVLSQSGRREEALALYERALALQPDNAEALNNRGHARLGIGANAQALADFDHALAVKPDYADAHNNRGVALARLSRQSEALASFERALALRPDYASALSNRANALRELERLDEALASYAASLKADPAFAEAYNNRGLTLQELGRLQEAQGDFACAIAIRPAYAEAIYNRGTAALLSGDYANGWRDCEKRWRIEELVRPGASLAVPLWRGESLGGKRVLVWEEQGLGDILQFARFLPALAACGGQVTFAARASLHRVLRTLPAPVRLVERPAEGEAFDFQSPLLSLPGALGVTLRTLPAAVPYLTPEPALVAKWRERIGDGGLKIGICWQGTLVTDKGRSAPLRQFRALAAIPGVRLISLQKVNGLEQLAHLPDDMRVETLGEDFESGPDTFADAAAVIAHLDLVMTTDTSIAHLAGALGRPVWIALKYAANWRWLLDRADSPWYPTARLYRQRVRLDWDEVFARMSGDIVSEGASLRPAVLP